MKLISIILLTIVGILIGWFAKEHSLYQKKPAHILQQCAELSDSVNLYPSNFEDRNISDPSADSQLSSPVKTCYTNDQSSEFVDSVIQKLIRSRNILPHDLTMLEHWRSLQDFDNYLATNSLSLTTASLNRLNAKANVFFEQNFIVALEALYVAMDSADNVNESDTIQGEINALLKYIQRQFFSEIDFISERKFSTIMNFAHEKQPGYLPVIRALFKHHLLMGDYDLAEGYIDSIPEERDNQLAIDSMKMKLKENQDSPDEARHGIPLQKHGNHFLVDVNINGEIALKLLLDTGASRTTVSNRTMHSMRRMSDQIIDLDMHRYVRTANGVGNARIYQIKELAVSEFKMHDTFIIATNLADDKVVHGLLGMDFLGQYQFRIDHQENKLYLSR